MKHICTLIGYFQALTTRTIDQYITANTIILDEPLLIVSTMACVKLNPQAVGGKSRRHVEAFAEAVERGRAMTMEQAIEYALENQEN